jgi:hypothetical protein
MGTRGNQLEYASCAAWYRRPGSRRAIVVAAVLFMALGSMRYVRSAWGHAKLLYWQRLCMRHERPASEAIDFSKRGGNKEWLEYYALLSPPGRKAAPIVFLHGMRHKDGAARLVAIEPVRVGESHPGDTHAGLWFDYHVIAPGGAWSRPRLLRNDVWHYPGEWQPMKLYAAQIDPQDASHFTVRFELERRGVSGVVDGWLQADDSLLLEVRRELSQAVSAGR